MNKNLQLEDSRASAINGASSRKDVALQRDRTRTISHGAARPVPEVATVVKGRNGSAAGQMLVAPAPKVFGEIANGKSPVKETRINARQLAFRCVRLTLAGGLVSCAVMYARTAITTARSEQAFINAEITALRAPIAGQVRLESIASGRTIRAGKTLFSIENARFGNEQAVSQLNFVTELAERLQAESEEAAVRLARQEEVTRLHEKMFAEQVLSRLELIEEQSKLALARTVLTNKLALAKKATERTAELTRQVQLQQNAVVKMPFDGLAWTLPAKDGAQLALNETVIEVINPSRMWVDAYFNERHANKLSVGSEVTVETEQGELISRGRVELVRAGVGRISFDGVTAVSPSDYTQRRIAVRVQLESGVPFEASQFFGLGRNVVVRVNSHD